MGQGVNKTLLATCGIIGTVGVAWGVASAWAARLPLCETYHPEELITPDGQFLEVDGRSVAYREMGTGQETLLFLHGFSGEMQTWQFLQPILAKRYRTIAIDLWGFGASARPPRLTPEEWRDQVFGTMDQLHVPSAAIIGHSMGGRVALACAAKAPHRVNALILFDCDGMQFPSTQSISRFIAGTPTLRLVLRRLRHDPRELMKFLRLCYGTEFSITEEILQRYRRPLCVCGTEQCWTHLGLTYPGTNFTELLSHISCRTLLVWGANDRITPVHNGIKLVERLPHAELIVIPEAGHVPHETRPTRALEYVRYFLTQQSEYAYPFTLP